MTTRLDEFAAAVSAMRKAQLEYEAMKKLAHSSQEWQNAIVRTREAERLVDWWIRKLQQNPDQERLFE